MTSRITVNNIESNSGISSIALDSGVTIETGSGLNVSSGILTASTLSATTVSTTTVSAGGSITASNKFYGDGSQLTAIPGANITGTIPQASLSNVDLSGIKKDIALLSLQNAVDTNRVAYNLANSFVDQFENDTGIGASTGASRNTINELLSCVQETSHSSDSNTELLILSNTSDGATAFSDSGPDSHGINDYSGITHKTNQSARGTSSMYFGGGTNGNHLRTASKVAGCNLCALSNNWTIECWLRTNGNPTNDGMFFYGELNNHAIWRMYWNGGNPILALRSATNWSWSGSNNYKLSAEDNSDNLGQNTWNHIAFSNDNGTLRTFIDGVLKRTHTGVTHVASSTEYFFVCSYFGGTSNPTGGPWWMDNIRVSDNARYTANFTPEVSSVATGIVTSKQNTVTGARTKVSGVMLYKDSEGTATLGTDLKISFTSNGGTNWTALDQASDYSAGSDFSTGVKTVYLAEKTTTSGTDVRYKIEWANQSGSKTTEVHGMAINY